MSDPDPASLPNCGSESVRDSNVGSDAEPIPPATTLTDAATFPHPVTPRSGMSITRLLYNHNPFYLISACLFVYGLKTLFRVGNQAVLFDRGTVGYIEPWGLMVSLAAVTLLMALTAIFVVRILKVWEDARSIVMVVLLMFLAISVSFDELLNVKSDRDHGGTASGVIVLMSSAVCFSIGLAEMMIRGLRLRLAWSWRIPLYTFLLLFFSYPVLLLPEVLPVSKEQVQWLIAAFPLVAAGVTLTLIPAIRQGAHSVSNNGTPWSWPLFPWSPFVMIACAVVFRSYSLTISFDVPGTGSHFWDSTFGVYLLVPFLLAVCVLLLEIGLTERIAWLRDMVLFCSPALLLLAHPEIVPWHRLPSYAAFLDQLTYSMASPVYLTLAGLLLFFGWAVVRGVRGAEWGVVISLILLATVPIRFPVDRSPAFGFRSSQVWPLIVLAVMQTVICWRRRSALAALLSIASIAISLSLFVPGVQSGPWRNVFLLHAALAGSLVLGHVFHDELADFFRELSRGQLSLTTVIGSIMLLTRDVHPGLVAVYVVAMTLLALGLAWLLKDRFWLLIVKWHCLIGLFIAGIAGVVAFFRMNLRDGTRPVILAGASFLAAVLISAWKSRNIRVRHSECSTFE